MCGFLFAFGVVLPAIVIFGSVYWNRSLPFDYVDMSFVRETAYPGETVRLRFIAGRIDEAISGKFVRVFYDGTGIPAYLGTYPTEYDRYTEVGKRGVWYKSVRIPCDAEEGESLYTSSPSFWRNPIQGYLYPIKAPIQKAKIKVLKTPEGVIPACRFPH